MPPRPVGQVHGINDRSIWDWFNDQPTLTRSLLVIWLTSGASIALGFAPLYYIYLDWGYVFTFPIPQVWRLLANFSVIGKPSINYLFQIIWLLQYGAAYEKSKFGGNTADALTMAGFGAIVILLLDLVISPLHAFFHGQSLNFMLLYLWSKQNPTTPVSLFGLIKFQAQYLPFMLMALDFIQGGSITLSVVGILAGHMYYFLTEIYPQRSGVYLIKTPTWLARLVHKYNLGTVPVQQLNAQHPSDVSFRAFRGAGRRLAD